MDPSIRFSFIEANGVTLHCPEAGPANGPLVVLLHGFSRIPVRVARIFSAIGGARLPAEPA